MSAQKPYSPIQRINGVIEPIAVKNLSEFSAFLGWLSPKSSVQKDARRKVYEQFASSMGLASNDFEGKSQLIEAVSGEFFARHMQRLVSAAKRIDIEAIRNEETADKDEDRVAQEDIGQIRLMEQVQREKDLLYTFYNEAGAKLFNKMCSDLNYKPQAIKALIKSFEGKGEFVKELVGTLQAPGKKVKKNAVSLMESYHSFCSLPKARALMLGETNAVVLDSEQMRVMYNDLAPLIEYIGELQRPERAEIMMRFEQYIASGYAQMDVDGKIKAGVSEEHKASIENWHQTLKAFKENPSQVSSNTLVGALNDRMGYIFYELQIKGSKGLDKKEPIDGVYAKVDQQVVDVRTFNAASVSFTSLQASGTPDGVCVSADGKSMILGFATSLQTLKSQGNQWLRHLSAVKNLMEYKKNLPGFEKVQSVVCTVLSPSWISAPGEKGAQAGASILEYFENQSAVQNTMASHARACLNILPFLNTMITTPELCTFNDLNCFRVNIVGASGSLWNHSIGKKEDASISTSEHAAATLAGCYTQVCNVLIEGKFKPFSIKGLEHASNIREQFELHIADAPNKLLEFIKTNCTQEEIESWTPKTFDQYIEVLGKMSQMLKQVDAPTPATTVFAKKLEGSEQTECIKNLEKARMLFEQLKEQFHPSVQGQSKKKETVVKSSVKSNPSKGSRAVKPVKGSTRGVSSVGVHVNDLVQEKAQQCTQQVSDKSAVKKRKASH